MQRDEEINRGEKKALLEVSGEGGRPPGRRTVARKVLRGIGAGLCVALVVGSCKSFNISCFIETLNAKIIFLACMSYLVHA